MSMVNSPNLYVYIMVALAVMIVVLEFRRRKQRQEGTRHDSEHDKSTFDPADMDIISDEFVSSPANDSGHGGKKTPTVDSSDTAQSDFVNDVRVKRTEPTINAPSTSSNSMSSAIPNNLVVLNIIAEANHEFTGYELLQALLSAGLRYGKMNIFHRHEHISGKGKILFSLAAAKEPGTFDIHKMGGFSCKGLTLFMELDAIEDPVASFEIMLQTADTLVQELDTQLQDIKRRPLTDIIRKEYRANIRQYEKIHFNADLFAEQSVEQPISTD